MPDIRLRLRHAARLRRLRNKVSVSEIREDLNTVIDVLEKGAAPYDVAFELAYVIRTITGHRHLRVNALLEVASVLRLVAKEIET